MNQSIHFSTEMQTSNNSNVLGIQKSLIWGEAESATSFPVSKSEKMKTMSGLSASLCPVTECRRLPVATGNVLEKALKKRAKQPDFFFFFCFHLSVCVCFSLLAGESFSPYRQGQYLKKRRLDTWRWDILWFLFHSFSCFFLFISTRTIFLRAVVEPILQCLEKIFCFYRKNKQWGGISYVWWTYVNMLSPQLGLQWVESSFVSFWRLMYYFHFEFWCQKNERNSLVSWPPARLLLWVTAESLQTSWALGVWRYRLCTQTD